MDMTKGSKEALQKLRALADKNVATVEDLDTLRTDNAKQRAELDEAKRIIEDMRAQLSRGSISLPGLRADDIRGKYSMSRACHAVLTGKPEYAPYEWEISEQTRKRLSSEAEERVAGSTTAPRMSRIMTTLTDSLGGLLVPDEVHSTLINKLDAAAVVKGLGVTVVRPRGYPFKVNKITAGTTASMVGEGSAASASDLTLGRVNLYPKKCMARTVITQEQVMWGTPQTDALVENDLALRIGLKEDQQILHGAGAENEVTGVHNTTGINTVAGISTTEFHLGDINKATRELAIDDADISQLGLVMHPGLFYEGLNNPLSMAATGQTLAQGAGYVLMPPFVTPAMFGTMTGVKLALTTQASVTLGGGANESHPVLADWRDYFFGEFGGLVLARSDIASDGTHHAFIDGKVHVVAVTWFDGACIRPLSFCTITGIVY